MMDKAHRATRPPLLSYRASSPSSIGAPLSILNVCEGTHTQGLAVDSCSLLVPSSSSSFDTSSTLLTYVDVDISMASSPLPSNLVGVAFLPHGTMILDPTRPDLPAPARILHSHCMAIGSRIAALSPTLFLLSTSHGLMLQQSAAIYQPYIPNATAEGSSEWKEQWADYRVKVRLDGDESGRLLQHLRAKHEESATRSDSEAERLPVEALVCFAGLSTPLRWGETVPLHFALHDILKQQRTTSSTFAAPPRSTDTASSASCPSVIILSQPGLGVTEAERAAFRPRVPQLLFNLGRDVREYLTAAPHLQHHRIVLIISGDLAHCHGWADGTPEIYRPDPSYAELPRKGKAEAKLFDAAVSRWITGGGKAEQWKLDRAIIADEAGGMEKEASSCGYTGLLMLQGLIDSDTLAMADAGTDSSSPAASAGGGSSDWLLSDFTLQLPTYYGMMTALLTRDAHVV